MATHDDPLEVQASARRIEVAGAGLVDAVEVNAGYGDLLLLDTDGIISGLDLTTGAVTCLADVGHAFDGPPPENVFGITPTLTLDADAKGRFAAVVQDFGSEGLVLDLATGTTLLQLDAGDQYPATVPASVAFVEDPRYGTVLVHRTASHRLDATALPSGQCLTDREFEKGCGPQPPPHFCDCFFGAIYASPDARWMFCDGWFWHPIVIPYVFDLAAWLGGDRYCPEDDFSGGALFSFGYDLTLRCVWLDDSHIAIWWRPEPSLEDNGWFDGHPLAKLVSEGTGAVFIVDIDEALSHPDGPDPAMIALPIPVTGRRHRFGWPIGGLFRFGDLLAVNDGVTTALWDWRNQRQVRTLAGTGEVRLLHQRRGSLIGLRSGGIEEILLLTWPRSTSG